MVGDLVVILSGTTFDELILSEVMNSVCDVLKELCKKGLPTEDQILAQYSRMCLAFAEMFPHGEIVDQLEVEQIFAAVDVRPEEGRARVLKEQERAKKEKQPPSNFGAEFVIRDYQ
eukprot:TRINITY_DN2439_c0_g1_i2.p2 TRINITY_DN2439_c0_g1~~TRINITY_DN2439_c0_g1_i2.p2  ORF type:complete len:116 (-),score=26.44 TRINITY_DN2439_c0_g1_i2:65-412(-)